MWVKQQAAGGRWKEAEHPPVYTPLNSDWMDGSKVGVAPDASETLDFCVPMLLPDLSDAKVLGGWKGTKLGSWLFRLR